jgi:hypothetical protein
MTHVVHADACGYVRALWTTGAMSFGGQTPAFAATYESSQQPLGGSCDQHPFGLSAVAISFFLFFVLSSLISTHSTAKFQSSSSIYFSFGFGPCFFYYYLFNFK